MFLTDAQLHEIRDIVRAHHTAFVANVFGHAAVDPDTLRRLEELGLLAQSPEEVAAEAYLYGQLLSQANAPWAQNLTYAQFKAHIEKNPIPLSPIELRAQEWAAHRAAQYVVGLGNRVDQATGALLIEADAKLREHLRSTIRDETTEAVARRDTAKQLKSNLGWLTGDWTRDLDRIAVTEIQESLNQGAADHIATRRGSGADCYKVPAPDACPHCKRLHIGPDGAPRIFKLSTLVANGTNVGRKARDWRAVVGTVHPNCACPLYYLPKGWGFDEDGDAVPGGELGTREDVGLERSTAHQTTDLRKARKLSTDFMAYQGLRIRVENRPGTVRHWVGPDGKPGQTKVTAPYGEVVGTSGSDGDAVDVFVGPYPSSKTVYLLHQKDLATGLYDEDKAVLGCRSEDEALELYARHYDVSLEQLLFGVTTMSLDQFRRVLARTEPGPEERLEPAPPVFVLPLSKAAEEGAGHLDTAYATETSTWNDRAPGSNLGVNYAIPMPPRKKRRRKKEAMVPVIALAKEDRGDGGLRRDRDIWEMPEPLHPVHPLPETKDGWEPPELLDPGAVSRNRRRVNTYPALVQGPPNHAEVDGVPREGGSRGGSGN